MPNRVPVLDLDRLASEPEALVAEAGEAYRQFGFCGFRNHGIGARIIDDAYRAFKAFFALPEDVKRAYRSASGGQRGYTPFGIEQARDYTVPDLKEFWQSVKWFLGRGARPQYGRWTYWEKFDYFAVFWGVAVIGLTGLLLWFPTLFTRVIPGWLLNVATIIHSDEALLAVGFIFTVHFFNTHFRPEKFPMDTVIFTGLVPIEQLKIDRPREYEMLVNTPNYERQLKEKPSATLTAVGRIFGFVALSIGIIVILMTIYSMIFLYQ